MAGHGGTLCKTTRVSRSNATSFVNMMCISPQSGSKEPLSNSEKIKHGWQERARSRRTSLDQILPSPI